MQAFAEAVARRYNKVPYHTFTHAFGLVQGCYWAINSDPWLRRNLSPRDVTVLLLAGLGHDLDHPGMNNHYLNAVKDNRSLVYNDRSPLENHHTSLLFQIMNSDDHNILSEVPKSDLQYIRSGIVEAILHTDMFYHDANIEKF